MSTQNTKIGGAAFGDWRIDPDHRQDRRAGEVVCYKLSEEELAKYQSISIEKRGAYKKPIIVGEYKRMNEEAKVKMAVVSEVADSRIDKISKEKVMELKSSGKSADDITEIFKPVWKGKEQLLKAKILLYMSDKRPGGHKKKEAKADDRSSEEEWAAANPIASRETDRILKELKDDLKVLDEEVVIPVIEFKQKSKYDRHMELCQTLNETYKIKNIAYGDSFGKTFKELGPISAATRMYDKFNRVVSLMRGAENQVKDERLWDTLMDLANYALMTAIEIERQEEAIQS